MQEMANLTLYPSKKASLPKRDLSRAGSLPGTCLGDTCSPTSNHAICFQIVCVEEHKPLACITASRGEYPWSAQQQQLARPQEGRRLSGLKVAL